MYYHVSSYIHENQILTQKSKNNRCFCEYISNCYAENYEEYKIYFDELNRYRLQDITGRDVYKWICEAVFEGVRKRNFYYKPSRVWGIYLTNSIEKALAFRSLYRDETKASIFEIDVSDEMVFGFDMSFFTSADVNIRKNDFSFDSYVQATELAKLYWAGKANIEIDEFLIDCPVTVGRCVVNSTSNKF